MRITRKIAAFVLACLSVLMLSGCSAMMDAFEDEALRDRTEEMLCAIIKDDIEAAYETVDDTCTEEDFVVFFSEIREWFDDVKDYELSLLSAYRHTNYSDEGTVHTSTASYKVVTSEGVFVVDAEMVSPSEDFKSFYIAPFEKTDYYSVGTLENMTGASAFQWIMLFSNIFIIGLVLFAFVDCCRNKVKLKALWLVVIAVGLITLGITASETNFRFDFNIGWFFAYNAFVTFGGGTKVIRFMMPVGAILYFALRGSLIKREQNFNVYPEYVRPIPPAEPYSKTDENTDA